MKANGDDKNKTIHSIDGAIELVIGVHSDNR